MSTGSPPAVRLLLLAGVLVLAAGCAAAPGMYMDDSRVRMTDAARESADRLEPELIPITPQLIRRQAQSRSGLASEPGELLQSPSDYAYRIGPGDVLTITVWDHPELTIPAGEFRDPELVGHLVSNEGTIFYPYAGTFNVAGLTTEEVRQVLQQRLDRYIQNPQLDVRVVAFRSKRAYVTGQVRQPGVLPITDRPLTVLEAINLAGGGTDEADLRGVILTRDDTVRRIDLLGLYQGKVRENLWLRDGDQVYVPDHYDNQVFVMGEVNVQSSVLMRNRTLTLAQALGSVEGLDQTTADPSRIYVIRGDLEQPKVYQLDARSPDSLLLSTMFELEPRDVIYVSIAGISRWNRVISQILPTVQTLWQTDRLVND